MIYVLAVMAVVCCIVAWLLVRRPVLKPSAIQALPYRILRGRPWDVAPQFQPMGFDGRVSARQRGDR